MSVRSSELPVVIPQASIVRPMRNTSPENSSFYCAVRMMALFMCLLVEGGWAIVPRTAVLGVATVLVFTLVVCQGKSRTRVLPLFVIPMVVLIATLARPGFDIFSAGARFVNFSVAIALLHIYMKAPLVNGSSLSVLEKDLSFILKLMAYQALATFVLGYAVPGIFRDIPVGDYVYRSAFYVLNYHMMYLDTTIRPDGFFYERGVFQLYLNLYLYLALFRIKSIPQAALALAALATTWSTTGLLTGFFIVMLYALSQIKRVNPLDILIFLCVVLCVTLPFGLFVKENLERKFYGEESASYLVRQSDLNVGIEVIKEAPLLGSGFDDDQIVVRMRRYLSFVPGVAMDDLEDRTISNGILRMTIAIGIPLTLLHFWGLALQTLFPSRLAIFTMVTFTLMSESIPFSPFLLCIMYSGLVQIKRVPAAPGFPASRGLRRMLPQAFRYSRLRP